jgi:2-keto-4-pentenoate hydratase/2-oxohepta-3-ene-1,7-dioic acid hydratase in catechol pathway
LKRSVRALALGLFAASALAASLDAQQSVRYVRYEQGGQASWGILDGAVENGTIRQLSDAPYLGGTPTGETVQRTAVKLLAPVDPRQIFMTAYNFRSHLVNPPAPYPGIFLVLPSSVVGPEDPIVRPKESTNFHYEAEMVVVIGREITSEIAIEDVPEYIFGVTAGNDGSERDWQAADLQWTRAKSARDTKSVGPVLVTGLDYTDLDISGRMNDETELRQSENSSDMLFDINFMVHYISRYMNLLPGDLVWSGTMNVTQQLTPGDTYHVGVEGVGEMSNEIIQGN